MNDQSPPKRVTRSRAAAKSTDAVVKTTKVATAAAKAKLTRTAPTATKRKTRTHDIEHEEDAHEEATEEHSKSEPRATRGRPKKVVVRPEPDPEPEPIEDVAAPTKTRRGRPRSMVAEAVPPPQSVSAAAPVRATRGRAKKAEDVEPALESTAYETKALPARSTRTRAVAVPKVTTTKKSVKFEDQDKENVVLVPAGTKGKEMAVTSATGLRAKPVRRPAAATARATRGRAKQAEERTEKSPLSPKKTQVSVPRDTESDDELATMEKTPMKPLSKSPVKPPGSIFEAAKNLDFSKTIAVDNTSTQELQGSTMTSPARRPPQSPFKESMKTSPQRLTLGDSLLRQPFRHALLPPLPVAADQQPLKISLLQSPARRPVSPTKVTEAGSPTRTTVDLSMFNATPKPATFAISRFTTPKTLPRPAARAGLLASSTAIRTGLRLDAEVSNEIEDSISSETPQLKFSGRLSSIVSRDLDPTVEVSETIPEETECPFSDSEEKKLESDNINVNVDVEDSIEVDTSARTTTPPCSPPPQNESDFVMPGVDENPFVGSDSEDELSAATPAHSSVPLSAFRISTIDLFPSPSAIPFTSMSETIRAATLTPSPKISRAVSPENIFSAQRNGNLFNTGKPPSEWTPGSPTRQLVTSNDSISNSPGPATAELQVGETTPEEPSPVVKNSFFEEEMSIRQDELVQGEESPAQITEQVSLQVPALEPGVSPVEVDEEDIALAAEADEMSLLESEAPANVATEDVMAIDADPEPSEDSQEYGDENAMPLDPALFTPPVAAAPETPVRTTPKRVLTERISHTVSKVPLKPAAEDTPRRPLVLGRSATVSRLPTQKPTGMLKRNNTVISYSPAKKNQSSEAQQSTEDVVMKDLETPSKSDSQGWSTAATPARTPRRDLNTALLKGAVVFVDVHTTEGADASGLFTELLTQMGARCVKTWNWNGNTEDGSKIGITHIVFKDGGKRTLEKARETGGVVACVGVGWVLDCERENKWLDEAPYAVDTSLVPRGGHRRRKSMEPRVLANLNGQLVSTSMTPSRKSLSPETPITSKVMRRDTVQWVRSPASSTEEDSAIDDKTLALSPVPATPAPEAISAYAEDFLNAYEAVETPYFLHAEKLTQQTCPPPKRFSDMESPSRKSSAFISEKKDEDIMARLMAARRKSLQWAPKVGSPLAKGASWSRSP